MKVPGFSTELLVLENIFVLLVAYFVKVIHVELSHEGGEVTMAKVDGENLLLKLVDVDDDEVGAFLVPGHHILIIVVLNRNRRTYKI